MAGRSPLRWVAVAVAAVLVLCGAALGYSRFAHRSEARRSDRQIRRYLTLVQERDRPGADAMLCGGDDTGSADLRGPLPRVVASFAVVRGWDWSSVTDGHGRVYQVRLGFTDGSSADVELAVEVIGDEPCVATAIPF